MSKTHKGLGFAFFHSESLVVIAPFESLATAEKNSDAMMKELESGTGCAVVIYAESKKGTGILATRGG